MTTRRKQLGLAAIALVAMLGATLAVVGRRPADAQQAPSNLTIAIYAPSAAFADAAARLAYVQGLAKAIQTATGIPTTGKAYVKLSDMLAAKPDYAIVEGVCVANKSPGTLLAVASIGGDTKQAWGLYSRGDKIADLKGKKLAYVATGCNDDGFMDNALLRGEIKTGSYFGQRIAKVDAAAAVATVRDVKQADAVLAPSAIAKGLTRIIDTDTVPTPGFVQVNGSISATTTQKVQSAVLAYGAGGGIDGWKSAAGAGYGGFAGRMGKKNRPLVMAQPERVDINDQDVVIVPQSPTDQATVKQHFWEPPAKRQ